MDDGVGSLTWTSSTIKMAPDQLTLTNALADVATHTHILTQTDLQAHTHANTHDTCRHTETEGHRHTHIQKHQHTHTQTNTHRSTT